MATQTNLSAAKLLSVEQVATILETKLEDESRILDALVAEAIDGRPNAPLWRSFNEAARRDDLLPEVAFAYEQLARSKRLKAAPNPIQADVLMHAVRFFSEVFGDGEGATEFLERVVALQPDHSEAIPQLERILIAQQNWPALASLYETTAPARAEPKERIALLTRAAELLDRDPAESDHVIRLYEQLLEVEPSQPRVRRALETRYLLAGRAADAAAFLEHVFASAKPPEDAEAFAMRTRLMGLYAGELGDVERALPHLEALLARDPAHEKARLVATELLGRPSTRGRAASLLADVFGRLGNTAEAANMIAVGLAEVEGPERAALEKRLAILQADAGDLASAHALLEAVVLREPGDDEVRRRFREVSAVLDRRLAAADTLALAASSTEEPALRAKLGMELGEVLMDAGDVGRARAALQEVVDVAGDDTLTLLAARELVGLYAIAREHQALAAILELLAARESDDGARAAATERVAHLYQAELDDPAKAIAAWRKLEGGPRGEQARASLAVLYEKIGSTSELADTLEGRAKAAASGPESRLLGFRAAELRAGEKPEDPAHALAIFRAFVAEFGPDRNAHARLAPLLEAEALWGELAEVLEGEIALAPEGDRPPILAKLARLQERLGDPARAVALAAEAIALDAKEPEARAILEAALVEGAQQAAAASALEVVHRAEQNPAKLLEVLRIKGAIAERPADRLGAFEEAVGLAEREIKDPKLALELAGVALIEAVLREPKRITSWLDRVERLASLAADPDTKAAMLDAALSARAIDSKAMARLGRRTGAALEAAGEFDKAIVAYQAALAFEPSPELDKRVQKLILERRTPEERVATFEAELAAAAEPRRRREIFGQIATIQRDELRDLDAAVATWRRLLAEQPDDAGAHEALLLAFTALGDAEARLDVARALAFIKEKQKDSAGAFALLENVVVQRPLDLEARAKLKSIGAAIKKGDDVTVALLQARARLEARRDSADSPELEVLRALVALYDAPSDATELAATLEALGDREPEAATRAGALGRAGHLRKQRGEIARALSLFARALAADPTDASSRAAVTELLREGEHRAGAADILEPILRAEGDANALGELLEIRAAASADAATRLVAIDRAIEVLGDPGRALDLAVQGLRLAAPDDRGRWLDRIDRFAASVPAAARVPLLEVALGNDDAPEPRLARMLADALEASGALDRALAIYQKVLAAEPSSLELKVRVYSVMMNRAEETLGSREAAVGHVAKHVLALPADEMDAALAIALLLPAVDGVEGTLAALRTLRARSEGALGVALDVIAADVLLNRLGRHDEALALIEDLVTRYPDDRAPLPVLGRAIALEATRERATALVERAAAATEDASRAVALLERLAAAHPREPRQPRIEFWEALCDRLEARPEVALGLAVVAAAEMPDEDRLWDRAERSARALDRPGPVADAYERLLAKPLDEGGEGSAMRPADRAVLQKVGHRAVDFFEEWFDDERPQRLLAGLLRADPEWAFERLKLALSSSARWEDLFRLYDERVGVAPDDAARAAILEEASQVARDFAGDASRAIGYLERLAALRPGDARVDAALERLYEREVLRPELIALLAARLAPSSELEESQHLRARIAGLWLDLGDEGMGFARVEEMLAAEPERAEAFALLERVVLRDRAGSEVAAPLSVELLRRGAALLRARYAAEKRPKDLVRAVSVELETARDSAEKITKHRELADLRLELVDYAAAFEDVAALVALEPAREEHVEQLSDLAAALDRHPQFAAILVSAADVASDPRDQARLVARAATVARDQQKDAMRAIELFTRVIALAKDDPARLLATARELEPLLNVAGMDAERCGVLETIAGLEGDPAARRAAFGQVARIAADTLKDEARAVAAWRARLADDKADREALDGLAEVLARAGRHQELIEVLDRRAEIADVVRAKRDRIQIAKIHLEELGVVTAGIAAWQRVRDAFGPDEENFAALSGLLEIEGRFPDLAALLEHQADHAGDKARAVELFRRLGDLERDRIGKVGPAASAYRAALSRDPRDQGSRSGLASLLDAPDVREEAIDVLSRAYAETGDWEHAADLAKRLAGPEDVASDLGRSFWWGVALHHRDAKGDPEAAEWAFGRALAHDPTSEEVLTSLANVQRRAPGRALIDTLLRLSDVKGGDLDLLQEAADVAINPLADREMAVQSCEKLLDLAVSRWTDATQAAPARREGKKKKLDALVDSKAPKSVAAWSIEQLVRMSLEASDHRRAVGLYQRGASLPFERAETRRLKREAAVASERDLADAAGAIELYAALFAEDPADRIAAQSVETFAALLEQADRHADVVDLWEKQAGGRADANDRDHAAELWARAANLAEERLGDVERAIAAHDHGADLGGLPSLEALARLHGGRGDHRRAAATLERICSVTSAPEAYADATLRLAEAYVRAGERATARSSLERGAELFPGARPLRARLAELYREDAAWDPLATLHANEAARADAPDETLAALRLAIELHLFKRADPDAAIPLLERALAIAPDDAVLALTLAESLFARGRHDASIKVLEAELERYGSRKPKERALAHYALARAAAAAGDKKRALGELDQASRIDRGHAGVLHALGRLATELADYPRATRSYQALLLLGQHHEEAAAQHAYQELLDLHRQAGDAKDGDVGRAEILLELADIAEHEGDAVRAAEFRESAAEAGRSSPEEAERLARALEARTRRSD